MKVLDEKCPGCGSKLVFNPIKQKMVCTHCKGEYDVKDKKINYDQVEDKTNEFDIYSCPSCGAEIIADTNTTATFCLYCKNTAILKNKLSGEFHPNSIIPFYKTKDDAINAFKEIGKKRPLMPDTFSDPKNIAEMSGIYIPFWLYDCSVDGKINFVCKRITTWSVGNRIFTKTDTYDALREGTMHFDKVPVDGSEKFDNDIMRSIEPFKYADLKEFNSSYLSGFFSEKYDVDSIKAFEDAKLRIENSIINTFQNDVKAYNSVNVSNKNITIKIDKQEYVLLPVWMLNIKYNDKIYKFAMNGQTGKLIGNIPVSKKKAFIMWIKIFLITFAIMLLIMWLIWR